MVPRWLVWVLFLERIARRPIRPDRLLMEMEARDISVHYSTSIAWERWGAGELPALWFGDGVVSPSSMALLDADPVPSGHQGAVTETGLR